MSDDTKWADTGKKKAPVGEGKEWFTQIMAVSEQERKAKYKELLKSHNEKSGKDKIIDSDDDEVRGAIALPHSSEKENF